MKKVVLKDREYLELPDDLKKQKLMIIKLEEGLYLVGRENLVRDLVKRQVRYVLSKKKLRRNSEPVIREERPIPQEYWVFDTEQEAFLFSRKHADEFQRGEILGIRGFDGKYYAVRKRTYDAVLPKILRVLKERPSTVEELSEELGLRKGLVRAVLELAREEGLVVERSGGVYQYAG